MIFKVDYKVFVTEFKELINKGYSFYEALELLKARYGEEIKDYNDRDY